MTSAFVTGLLDLWTREPDSREAAEAAFAEWYADPVVVNGASLTVADLVDRAEEVRATYPVLEREVLDVLETPEKVAVCFRMADQRVIDILTLTDGRISTIWMAATPWEG